MPGSAVYDLSEERAQKTGEWREGIGRLDEGRNSCLRCREALAPYLGSSGRFARTRAGPLSRLARDRAPAHPDAGPADARREASPRCSGARRRTMKRDKRVKAWSSTAGQRCGPTCRLARSVGWCSSIPPFEDADEFERMARESGGLAQMAHRRLACCGIRSRTGATGTSSRPSWLPACLRRCCGWSSCSTGGADPPRLAVAA